jgi:cell division protein FtsB
LRFLRIDHRALFARKQFTRLVGVLAFVWVAYLFLISDHSIFRYTMLGRENEELSAEIARTELTLDSLNAAVRELDSDRERIERVARERYHFVGEDEKAYVFVEVEKEDAPRLLEQAVARRREAAEEEKRTGERH